MAYRRILTYPSKILRETSLKVKNLEVVQSLITDLSETMYLSLGAGLAAPQISVLKRVFVVDIHWQHGTKNRRVFINPAITKKSDPILYSEGCLSFPNVKKKITRFSKITVEAKDEFGKPFKLKATGYLAQAIQHEIDHLDGILLIDPITRVDAR